jgi:hypothetical protein
MKVGISNEISCYAAFIREFAKIFEVLKKSRKLEYKPRLVLGGKQ